MPCGTALRGRCSGRRVSQNVAALIAAAFITPRAAAVPNTEPLVTLAAVQSDPLFTIITPAGRRPTSSWLPQLARSIDFDQVDSWIVVLGGTPLPEGFHPGPKVHLINSTQDHTAGHMLYNVGLAALPSSSHPERAHYVYRLDDDNLVHPNFWAVLPGLIRQHIAENKRKDVYTFAACREGKYFPGDKCQVKSIDSAQFVVDRRIATNWTGEYEADGKFISDKCSKYGEFHVDQVLANYNALKSGFSASCLMQVTL